MTALKIIPFLVLFFIVAQRSVQATYAECDYFRSCWYFHSACPSGSKGNFEKTGNFSPTSITQTFGLNGQLMAASMRTADPPWSSIVGASAFINGLSVRSYPLGTQIMIPVSRLSRAHSDWGKSPYRVIPAAWSARSIWLAKNLHSMQRASGITATSFTELPFRVWMASNWSLVQGRAVNARILSCCRWLIASSNTNNDIVKTAPIRTPPITRITPSHWRQVFGQGLSMIIPAATANSAAIEPPNRTAWVQSGSSSPARNLIAIEWIASIVIGCAGLLALAVKTLRRVMGR